MATPQQPGLRSFIVMGQLPANCISFEATGGHVAPHIRAGDFAVIDTADREPMHGELFLVEWESNGRRQLIEVARFDGPERIPTWDGVTEYWNALWYAPMRFVDGREAETMRWFDGPYRAAGLASRIVGRVVGIYQPDFRRQLVVAGGR